VKRGQVYYDEAVKRTDPVVKQRVDPILTPVLDRVEGVLDYYLPEKQDGEPTDTPTNSVQRVYFIGQKTLARARPAATQNIETAKETGASSISFAIHHPLEVPKQAFLYSLAGVLAVKDKAAESLAQTKTASYDVSNKGLEFANAGKDKIVATYEEQASKDTASAKTVSGKLLILFRTGSVLTGELLGWLTTFGAQKKDEASAKAQELKGRAGEAGANAESYADKVKQDVEDKAT